MVTVDLSKNPKQWEYFLRVAEASQGGNNFRKFVYGGAIRGGKTYVSLFIFCWLCKKFPGSKWHVIRKDFPALQATSIESMKKILRGSKKWKWHEEKGNYYVERIEQGSRIYFIGENIDRDKDLNDFLGLETNGFLLEQLEELSEKLWDISSSRAGSWYIDPMPPPLMLTTFNPTQRWPKKKLHEPYLRSELPDDTFYMTALPSDNAFVTDDQWKQWKQMNERYYKQLVEGDWTDFDDDNPRWAFAFDGAKHIRECEIIPNQPLYLSFDFNYNPMTCLVMQCVRYYTGGCFIHILKEFVLPKTDVKTACMIVKNTYPKHTFIVTGDATGRARNAGYTSGEESLWAMVISSLSLGNGQLILPTVNPSHSNSRALVNSLLQNHPNIKIHPQCEQLIHELRTAKPKATNNPDHADQLDKGAGDSEKGYNVMDCCRYIFNTFFADFVEI